MTITFASEADADLVAVIGSRRAERPRGSELRDRIFTIIDRLAARELEGPQQRLATGDVVHS